MSRLISKSPHRRAFTLIELLVVIGIIGALMALSLVAILRAHKQAVRTRMQADLAAIGTALESYKQDFGDYPRFDDNNVKSSLNMQTDRGAILLCQALIGPGSAAVDGADGPGFRVRPGGQGKVYGPYIPSDKFRLSMDSVDDPNNAVVTMLDSNGNPILYYPATPGIPNPTVAGGFVTSQLPPGYGVSPGTRPLYNAVDNTAYPVPKTPTASQLPNGLNLLSANDMQYILGDRDNSGNINGNETAVTTQPYLLWTAGADGIYGRDANGKTDDVTNFDIPPDLRK